MFVGLKKEFCPAPHTGISIVHICDTWDRSGKHAWLCPVGAKMQQVPSEVAYQAYMERPQRFDVYDDERKLLIPISEATSLGPSEDQNKIKEWANYKPPSDSAVSRGASFTDVDSKSKDELLDITAILGIKANYAMNRNQLIEAIKEYQKKGE